MWARSSHQRVATFFATVSRLRSGGWSTQQRCSILFVAARFLQPQRAPSHIRLDSKTALGKISNKQLCYLCKASGAGCFCMHGRISLSVDSWRNLKQPLKHNTLHPTYKEDSYFCLFSHKRELNFIMCYYFSFTQSWSNLTTLLKDEKVLLSKRSLRRGTFTFFLSGWFLLLKVLLAASQISFLRIFSRLFLIGYENVMVVYKHTEFGWSQCGGKSCLQEIWILVAKISSLISLWALQRCLKPQVWV